MVIRMFKFNVILFIFIWFFLRLILSDGNMLVYGVLTTIIYIIIKLGKKLMKGCFK